MNLIPETVYKAVEAKIRQRWDLVPRAEDALARAKEKAASISSPAGGRGGGRRSSATSSKTERAAISVVRAEKRLETARMWESVFLRMDKIFPENSTEGYVAGMVYGNGISQAELARISGCSRQTIKLRQDRYVIRLALLAAQAGLIKREAMTDNGKADQAERGIETY